MLAIYGQHWALETTFVYLSFPSSAWGTQSRGFNLEDTPLTHPQRLHLLELLAWPFLWALLVSEQLHHTKLTPQKNTDDEP